MIIVRRAYKRKYQVGGSGIFSKLKDVLSKFISKNQVVDTALNTAKSSGRTAGQKSVEFVNSKLTPKLQEILSKLISSPSQGATPNLNNLISGSGQRAIKI